MSHDTLLKGPPPAWYELVREMRGLLGKKPPPVKAPPAADTAGPASSCACRTAPGSVWE